MRIPVQHEVAFVELAGEALGDDCLGLTLAADLDCREFRLLYYVLASSDTLGSALQRVVRYSRITNEAIISEYKSGRETLSVSATRAWRAISIVTRLSWGLGNGLA